MNLLCKHPRRALSIFAVAIVAGGAALGATELTGRATASLGTTLSGVPSPVQQALQAQYGITVANASPTASDTASSQAVAAATASFAELGGDATSTVAVRIRFTDPHYGAVTEGKNNTVSPYNVEKDAWLVLIPNTTNFIFAPPGSPAPSSYTATLAVFVDATTGNVIEAQTVPAN